MEYIKIGDIAKSIVSGGTPKSTKSEYYNGNIPWLNTKEINFNRIYSTEKCITDAGLKNSSAKYIKENCVIIAMYGATAGRAAINKIPLTTNQACCNIEVDASKMDYNYVYYAIKNDWENLASLANGGAQQNLNSLIIKEFKIPYVDLNTQKKVSKILFSIDKKIELNNEINNNLQELEKNLYKEYFKTLSDENTKKLGELCNIKYGKGLPTKKIEKEGYPVYGGNGIIGYYHEFMYDNSQVLISCRGAASGNVIVSKPKSFVTNNSLILECDRKYHYYLKQYSLDNYYYEYTTGSAQPQITIDNIKDIVLSIPSDELLESFNKQMENLELKYFSNLEETSKLEQLRDTLLPKLMNGEIDLDKIEIYGEEI